MHCLKYVVIVRAATMKTFNATPSLQWDTAPPKRGPSFTEQDKDASASWWPLYFILIGCVCVNHSHMLSLCRQASGWFLWKWQIQHLGDVTLSLTCQVPYCSQLRPVSWLQSGDIFVSQRGLSSGVQAGENTPFPSPQPSTPTAKIAIKSCLSSATHMGCHSRTLLQQFALIH